MLVLIFGFIVAVVGLAMTVYERRVRKQEHKDQLMVVLLTGSAAAVARAEPRELLAWQAAADVVRRLFPDAIADIESKGGESFPIPRKVVEAAHTKWTAEWLAWERQHDADFRKRTSVLQAELEATGHEHTPDGHARIAALEGEKLQSYQRRYEEYVQIGKGLTGLLDGNSK
jgi:hypothetical protein